MKEYLEKTVLMDEQAVHRALIRIAHEIIEKNKGLDNVALVGIQRRGVPMAERIAKVMEDVEGIRPDIFNSAMNFPRQSSAYEKAFSTGSLCFW